MMKNDFKESKLARLVAHQAAIASIPLSLETLIPCRIGISAF